MKKFGIGSRLLALLLALTMIVSAFPVSVFAADGDISAGDPGLDKDDTTPDTVIDTKDTISWPIKVYDYLNDGLLFEYASAQDTSLLDMDGDAYGGGEPMPEVLIGYDFTYNGAGTTATTGAYTKNVYTYWIDSVSPYHRDYAQQGKDKAEKFKYLRLQPDATYADVPAAVITDFYFDDGAAYAKEAVRYAVLIYRTNVVNMQLNLGVSTIEDGAHTIEYSTGGAAPHPDGTGSVTYEKTQTKTLTSGDQWRYVVVDLNSGDNAARWSRTGKIYQVILDTNMTNAEEHLDLSHIAYFSNEAEAERFGEKASAFSNNPGEYLPTQYYEVTTGGSDSGEPAPSGANWSLDFTQNAAYSSATAAQWADWSLFNGTGNAAATKTSSDKIQYARFGCDSDSSPDSGIFVDFGSAQNITDIRYMTLVYRSSAQSAACNQTDCNQVCFWFESDQLENSYGYNYIGKGANVAHYYSFDHKTGWTAVTFDLYEVDDLLWEMNNHGVTTLDRIRIVCPGFYSGHGGSEYMDISHIAFHGDKTGADSYGAAALKYIQNPSTTAQTYTGYKRWNMGNNAAFTMLYASSGGGWGGRVGGENSWTNGYYSYQIGKHTGTSDNADTVNARREYAGTQLGYPVPEDIYFFNSYGSDSNGNKITIDMSTYDFGYKLLNLITDGVMTAGLLQNDLIQVKANDGTEEGTIYRIPQYKQSTVDYIAALLRDTLPIGETDHTGSYNYNFVKGASSSQFGGTDLATALRKQLGLTQIDSNTGNYIIPVSTAGSYGDTMTRANGLIGTYDLVKDNIKTFHDVAYYLLHNLFVDDSYNQLQDDYNYLVLSKAKVDGTEAFVFDGGFTTGNGTDDSQSAVKYDKDAGTISLISAVGKDQVTFSGNQLTTRYPFLPVQDSEGEYARTGKYLSPGTPYFEEDGAMSMTDYGATYATRNYNYVLQANAEFIYHVQDDLFFQFEGDDDVYLFVNNELVLDIGAAHSITKVKMNMNDYVLMAQEKLLPLKENFGYRPDLDDDHFHSCFDKALEAGFTINGKALTEADRAEYLRWHHLNLVGGETYPIDFYYMERHGWGANMRVATNIVMTDPAMDTEKKAYQDGAEITYGGIVDAEKKVEYSFSITNEGLKKLYNLKFHDYDIGLSLTPEEGLTFHKDGINGVSVTDIRGQTLEASDLVVHVEGYKDEQKLNPISLDIRFDGLDPEEDLKQFLRDLTSTDGTETEEINSLYAGKGLWRHATVTIRGIYYQLTQDQIDAEIFNNTVFTTANPAVNSETVLNSEDTHQIRVIGEAQHIYQWAGNEVYFSLADLAQWKGGSIKGYSADQLKVVTCTKAGQDYDYPDVLVKDYKDIYVNFLKTGTRLFFLKAQLDTDDNGKFEDMDGDGIVNDADTIIIPIMVYVTDLNDDIVVLDYGLKAELTGKNGITANDYITVPNHATSFTIMGLAGDEPKYLAHDGTADTLSKKNLNRISFNKADGTSVKRSDGIFEYADDGENDKMFFTPTSFMDETYSVYMAVTVHEGATPSAIGTVNQSSNGYSIDITKEVQMFQEITVVPATVMYYENDFSSLEYVGDVVHIGDDTTEKQQGVDQSVNYGADKVYQTNENKQSSLNSVASSAIEKYGELLKFNFQGTGFEIIGRTNAFDSGSLIVTVHSESDPITIPAELDVYDLVTGEWKDSDEASSRAETDTHMTVYLDLGSTVMQTTVKYYDTTAGKDVEASLTAVEGNRFSVQLPKTVTQFTVVRNYRKPVITEFSNDLDTVCTHDTHSTTGHCENCGEYVGHEYYQNVCNICGAPRQEFYLVGYINGANYGCEEDYQNMGQYKFEGGKVTATFKTDGYVFIKTSNNTNWFMTDGYPGTGTRSAFLYDTASLGDRSNKLHVPGGVQLTFTLAETEVGGIKCLNLSYTTANDDAEIATKTVYFNNNDPDPANRWDSVYAYYWSVKNTSMVEWPGKVMSKKEGTDTIYQIELPADAEFVVFNNNGAPQTSDLTVPGENMIYNYTGFNQGWSEYVEGQITLNFDKGESGWEKVYVYYWNDNEELVEWPGIEMTEKGTNVYTAKVPENATYVIFNNGKIDNPTNVDKTGDLDILVSGTAAEDTYTYGGGWASAGETTVYDRVIYFRNNDNWAEVKVHYWQEKADGTELNLSVWPGDSMDYVSENVYKATIPSSATHVIFNNNKGTQTANLVLSEEFNLFNYATDSYDLGSGHWTTRASAASAAAVMPVAAGGVIYLDNAAGWATPYAYYWPSAGSAPVAWPGVAMTKVSGNRYSVTVPDDCDMIIFNNNGDPQTDDLNIPADQDLFNNSTNGWSVATSDPEPEEPQETRLIYFRNTQNWSAVNIYYWSEANNAMVEWPGVSMTACGNSIYSYAVPVDAEMVIFNDGSTQTDDLTIPTDGNDLYDYTTKQWSVAQLDEEPVESKEIFFLNAHKWSTVNIYYWSEANNAMVAWPGAAMTGIGDDVFTFSIPVDAEKVIFNDGSAQTADLTIPSDGNFYTYTKTAESTWQNYTARRMIYLETANAGWGSSLTVVYWNAEDTTEYTVQLFPMSLGSTLYSVSLPMEAQFVRFSDGTNSTEDLTISDSFDKYTIASASWSRTTRTIYFTGSGTQKVTVTYSSDTMSASDKTMTQVKGQVYKCDIPVEAKYVIFTQGEEDTAVSTAKITLTDDYNLYDAGNWTNYNPSADYMPVIYFKNTQKWETVKVHCWDSVTKTDYTTWPGMLMTHVDGDVFMAKVPVAVDSVVFNNDNKGAQTVDLTLEQGKELFTMDSTGQKGQWSKFYRVETDAIHQVPVLRVDGLDLGAYDVSISGMPTYTDDVDWSHPQDFVKDTYMYIDGLRIYQPLGAAYEAYSATENGAQFKEVRNLILEGYAAVAQYEENKNSLYSGNVSWTENRNGTTGDLETVYIGNQVKAIDDYMLIGPNNEAYLNGNAQTQAVILYVSEQAGTTDHSLQIGVRGIDEGLFLKGTATGVNATLYLGVSTEDPDGNSIYGWTPIDTVLSGTEQYYTINYKNCPAVKEGDTVIYQVALYVRSGMLSFTNLKYLGMNVMSKEVGEKTEETLNNGILYKPEMESGSGSGTTGGSDPDENKNNDFYFTLESVSQQMAATEKVENTENLISLAFPTLSFEDEVFCNIYYDVTDMIDIVEMGLMTFDSLDADATVNEALTITSGYELVDDKYVVRSHGIAAKDLGRPVYFKVYAQLANGNYVYSDVQQYSALSYAESILTGNYTTEMKNMVTAMLNYGAAALGYFGGIDLLSDLLNTDVVTRISDYSADLLADVVKADASKTDAFTATKNGFVRKYPTVSFEGAFSINYYFTPDADVQGDMILYYWNAEDYNNADALSVENATGSIVMTPGAEYEAAVENIAAKDMDGTIYVAAVYTDGTNSYCSGVLAYSLADYCKTLATGTNALSNFAKATAVYGYYAKQLFG